MNKATSNRYLILVKYEKSLQDSLFWSKLFLLIFGGYIEFILSSYIAIYRPNIDYTFGEEKLSGEVLSYWVAIFAFPLIIMFTLGVSIWLIF